MKKIGIVLIFALIIGFGIYRLTRIGHSFSMPEYRNDMIVGHALGEINGDSYTNSKEAFELTYSKGLKTFEVDLQLTTDNEIVLCHKCSDTITTEPEFLNTLINDKYTPLSFVDLLNIMVEHPDITIILDPKTTKTKYVKKMFNTIDEKVSEFNDFDLYERFVVQIYNEKMYNIINDIHPYSKYIFTFYKRYNGLTKVEDMSDFESVVSWASDRNFYAVAMWDYFFNEETYNITNKYNMNVFVHTINDAGKAKEVLANGAYGVFTDQLSKKDLGWEK